jgi:hypothetical protein
MNVILAGNGMSIAYNKELALPALTRSVLDAFSIVGAYDGDLLAQFAAATGATDEGLESVLGSLDQVASALLPLQGLAALESLGPEGQRSVADAAVALAHVYRVGTGVTLGIIAERARGQDDQDRAAELLLEALPEEEPLTVATLNYDGIIPSRVLDRRGGFDLAAGYECALLPVVNHGEALSCQRLRDTDNLTSMTVVLNLHGSLGWLWHRDHGWWRFALDDLRRLGYWTALREGRTNWLPTVVLTNQTMKSQLVRQYPFGLAYDAFTSRLRYASRLIIAGYGFRDEYLNNTIGSTIAERETVDGMPPLKIAVIDKGDSLSDELIYETLPPSSSTLVFRDGVRSAIADARWTGLLELGQSEGPVTSLN